MQVLFLGCHCNDIELGCGATIHKHRSDWEMHASVLCSHGRRDGALEVINHIAEKSLNSLGIQNLHFNYFPPDNFHQKRQEIWKHLQHLKKHINPHIVITQSSDEHQDHETLYKESVRVFRQSTLLTYSVCRSQRYTNPDTFEFVSEEDVAAKLNCANMYREFYKDKNYFDEDNIVSQLRTNGIYPDTQFAEVYQTITRIGVDGPPSMATFS